MLGDRIAFLGNPTDKQIEELFGDTEFAEDYKPPVFIKLQTKESLKG